MILQSKKERLKCHFVDYPDEVQHIINCVSTDAIYENEVWDIDFLHEWSSDDIPVILIGDAAHAMTPKLGQGANIGLEDATELANCVGPIFSGGTKETFSSKILIKSLKKFEQLRVDRVEELHRISRVLAIPGEEKSIQFSRDRIYQWKPSFDNSL